MPSVILTVADGALESGLPLGQSACSEPVSISARGQGTGKNLLFSSAVNNGSLPMAVEAVAQQEANHIIE